jgi:hypothetical protein
LTIESTLIMFVVPPILRGGAGYDDSREATERGRVGRHRGGRHGAQSCGRGPGRLVVAGHDIEDLAG